MITGNGLPAASDRDEGVRVRDDSPQLRDIQDLIAKLEVVNKQLSLPVRTMRTARPGDASGAEGPGTADGD